MTVQVLRTAKSHLLQCATGEAVLRVGRTDLCHESTLIQNIYLNEQYHDSLLSYLRHQQYDEPLFIQVSTRQHYQLFSHSPY